MIRQAMTAALLAALLAAGLAGCAGQSASSQAPSGSDAALSRASLSFDGYRVSGSGGCNRIFGPAHVENGRLIVGPLGSTRMACPDQQGGDQALIDFLESRPRLIQGDNDVWRLENDAQQMVIERVPMQ